MTGALLAVGAVAIIAWVEALYAHVKIARLTKLLTGGKPCEPK